MENLFLENDLNKELQEHGFVSLPCLNKNSIKSLLNFYQTNTKEALSGFHPTMFHENLNYKKQVNELILSNLNNFFSLNINLNYKSLYGNFMVKESGDQSDMKLHQDWSYVNEDKEKSFAIWIPLIDLNSQNGALSVIPKSHKLRNNKRGPGFFCPFENWQEEIIEKYGLPLYLKAGEAVIWDHKLAHFSPPNLSNEKRIAITAIITPKNTPIYHFYKPNHEMIIETYEVNQAFFMSYQIQNGPNQNYISKEPYSPFKITKKELECILT
ncbi:MAG: hypothetical protein ACI8ZX_002969 [Planctomycetota bacterium]|jgi:hypothetical protein